jgi:hypothetical protein
MHAKIMFGSLYKISHIYFFAQNNCYALTSIFVVNKL